MKVVFSNRAYTSVLAETTEKIKTETGGLFLGIIQDGTWYIIESIDPGPKSVFEVAYFEYDQKYTQHLINKIANLYDQKLSLIGLWHRHPGSFDQFSSTDDGTNAKYALMREEGAISALVNLDPDFRITMYQVDRPCRYKKISYEIGDDLIPKEFLRFKSPEKFHSIMNNMLYPSTPYLNEKYEYHKGRSLSSFMDLILPQLKNNECMNVETNRSLENKYLQEKIVGEVIDDLSFMADSLAIETMITLKDDYFIVYQDTIDKSTKLYFMLSSDKQTVILSYEDKYYSYHKRLLTEAFRKVKEENEKNNIFNSNTKPIKSGVFDSVIKIIKLKRNEE